MSSILLNFVIRAEKRGAGFPFSFGIFQDYYASHEPFSNEPSGIAIIGSSAMVCEATRSLILGIPRILTCLGHHVSRDAVHVHCITTLAQIPNLLRTVRTYHHSLIADLLLLFKTGVAINPHARRSICYWRQFFVYADGSFPR